jgi:nicotinate-nucleotide pyrophosphorylase (carboxylating)
VNPAVSEIVTRALREDLGAGDVTTEFFVSPTLRAHGRIVAREKAVVAGTEVAREVFQQVDDNVRVDIREPDGSTLIGGETIMEIRGLTRSLLTGERVALNFLQRLSGVATLTRDFVDAIGERPARILDTRKTTPGLRALEKAAVVAGGGNNHRSSLHDMVLVKDNHLAARPSLDLAGCITRVRAERPELRVEIEADTLEQVRRILELPGVDVVLLDNMKPAQMREAVALGRGKVKFEASGGVTLKNIRQIAATGVDFISVGALTHSARAVDFSLELTNVAD